MYGIVVSFALITPLLLINHFLFNNIMNILIPLIVIMVTVSSLRHVKSSHWYFRVAPIVLIGIAVYLVLPSYTLSRAEQTIMESDSGIVQIEQMHNTPMENHAFAPFASKWFYTFRVTDSDGSEYELIFNPDSGEFFHKK
ncbi:hypothetical protein M9R32_08215 [Paenisporosarcina quisquiliarum]|uniref:Uncharacterized protein n=1 Tax=Paenisporosarcina quisquiliarum TaxID=365346 RepID=A0A9X3LGV0_9BACL|nr:hypothetical protein [Paenisporosarcina quisquiliarum]MCZ8537160.1 hypothetical protein [Paenisporosarcina quisquiliarum]